jgi:hypothetical protein
LLSNVISYIEIENKNENVELNIKDADGIRAKIPEKLAIVREGMNN